MPPEVQVFVDFIKQFGVNDAILLFIIWGVTRTPELWVTGVQHRATIVAMQKAFDDQKAVLEQRIQDWKDIAEERKEIADRGIGLGEQVVQKKTRGS